MTFGQGRSNRECRALLAACAVGLGLALGGELRAQPESGPPEMLADANLADVCFLDPDRGWAVGDRGVIWRTDDGGRHWRLDVSPVTCRLESLSLTGGQAFAVGGWTHPYTHKSSGVVLRTRDEARRWETIKSAALPALKQVRFIDARTGWALGNGSALYPAGVFKSDDGGRSWASVPTGKGQGWLTGDFRDTKGGILAGRDGSVALVAPAGLRPVRTPDFGARCVRRLRLAPPMSGWLVGDGGLVLTTADGGNTWQPPPSLLPAGVQEQFDFSAVAVCDKHVWIAGSPGTAVFHSADGGQTWNHFHTEQHLPVASLAFLDEHRGWAVGALGTILATTDGGRTWRRQHGGGTRAALLGLFSEAEQIPLELFARLSGDEGYLGQVELLNHRRPADSGSAESSAADRSREAMVSLGASGAGTTWRFPLGPAGLKLSAEAIADGWNRANDGRGLDRLEEHVVRKIRQWRPELIVTEAPSPRGDRPLAHLVNQVVMGAVEKAADADAYPQQASVADLAAWRVKKVCCALPEGERAPLTLSTAQLAARLGKSLSDQTSAARGLIANRYEVGPNSIVFQMPINRLSVELGQRDFFSGITLQPGGEARRALSQPPPGSLETLQRTAQKQRNIRQLLVRSDGAGGNVGWLSQVDELTRGLSPASAGEILYQLGLRYHESGQGELAAEAFELLVERHPDHALTESALVWLVQFYAATEVAWRTRGRAPMSEDKGNRPASFETPVEPEKPGRQPPRAGSGRPPAEATGKTVERARRAIGTARRIEQTRPALYADPAVRFPLAIAQRAQGSPRGAESFYHSLAENRTHDAWWACAAGELWLTAPTRVCPKRIGRCAAAADPPKLDGRLDDAVWKGAKPLELKSASEDDEQWPAQVMLAADREFLYLAVRCFKAQGASYAVSNEPRTRDADLSEQDRVEVLIDLDRDYATYYRLTVDHRGWTGEACVGDKSWNPGWFVAAASDDSQWTVEAAIPLAELTPQPPTERDVWAVGVQRTVPGMGFQSWTQPAALVPRGEGFGFLMFD